MSLKNDLSPEKEYEVFNDDFLCILIQFLSVIPTARSALAWRILKAITVGFKSGKGV